ncbi:MAG: EndoU domain-containing protein [Agathobacter sp.]|nr:EndoU domain-containing protein [Agathobacter sp.]
MCLAYQSGRNTITVTQDRLQHSTLGEFNSNGRLVNGGHGQANIDYMDANGIPYNIVKEYPNGVRVGNIPNHKNKFKRTGTGQAWFPKSWTDTDIKNAGEYVANLPENKNVSDGTWVFGEYNGVRVGIIKNDGEIGTIIPDNSRQP